MTTKASVEDRLAILELLADYADAVNQRDGDAWGALWAENGVWDLGEDAGLAPIQGRAAIRAMWEAAMPAFPDVVFLAHLGKLTVTGDSAKLRSYTSEAFTDPADGNRRRDLGQYDDDLIRVDGEWRFLKRRFRYLYRGH